MKRRFAGAAIGVIFSIFCGYISLLSTGGGHGSYMWISLFVIPELCGIYFAVMGFLGADLRASAFRWIFGILLSVNTIVSSIIIWGNVANDPYTIKAWSSDPSAAIFVTAIHVMPTVILATMLGLRTMLATREIEATKDMDERRFEV